MTRPTLKTKASVFSMGQRSEVLISELEAPILVPHALEKSGTKVTCFLGHGCGFAVDHATLD